MCLGEKLNFNHHVKEKIAKTNKGIGLIHKLAHVLPKQSLLTIYIYHLSALILTLVIKFM